MKHLIAIPQLQVVCLFLLLLPPSLVLSRVSVPAAAKPTTKKKGPPPHCPKECGKVKIPYPFGIGEGCAWQESFIIYCNHSHSPPRPYYRSYEVTDIKLDTGEMRVVTTDVARVCYNSSNTISSRRPQKHNFSPFLISPEKNEFTAIGCHTVALIGGKDWDGEGSYLSGCITTCKSLDDVDGRNCTGRGCCQIPTPSGLNIVQFGWRRNYYNPAWNYSRCSYSFIAEKEWYQFHLSHLNGYGERAFHRQFHKKRGPLVLNWAILNDDNPCVSEHSEPFKAAEGGGYLCNCSKGYTGNPYINGADGCKNINECEPGKSYCPKHSECIDKEGDYECKCSIGRRKIGRECRLLLSTATIVLLGTSVGSIILALILWFVCKKYKRQMQRRFFNKNGGKILKRMNIKTFTELQLEKITNNYNNPIGSGAFGKVFMGTTNDNRRVAVKRSIVQGDNPWHDHELASELAIHFWISHANLVSLIGFCLETDVPMLVYEYVSNGSLYNVLHGGINRRSLPLPVRLDIAIGSAKALSYMHSHSGHSLVHGDVKSGNILLGDNLTPKVSDFGASKLASIAKHANWCVVGDMSYIDPTYIKTGRFTEKSDVYSFGVVLLELITRKKAKYDGVNSLPVDFVKSCKEDGNGRAMYDGDIFSGVSAQFRCCYMECLDRIGALAVRCLKEDVDERPTMAAVVEELKLAKSSVCMGTSFDASENHIKEEARKACMLMSMSLRQRPSPHASSSGSEQVWRRGQSISKR